MNSSPEASMPPAQMLRGMLSLEIKPGVVVRDEGAILSLFLDLDNPEDYKACLDVLAAACNPNEISDPDGWGLVHFAARHADKGRIPWQWPLLQAAGLDVNAQAGGTVHGDGGDWPLHLAVLEGSEEDIKTLLAFGANVNALNNNGDNALPWCNPATARALIAAGVDINHVNDHGLPPLFAIARVSSRDQNSLELIKILIEAGADLTEPRLPRALELPAEAADLIRAARHARALEAAAPGPSLVRPRI